MAGGMEKRSCEDIMEKNKAGAGPLGEGAGGVGGAESSRCISSLLTGKRGRGREWQETEADRWGPSFSYFLL